MDNPFEFRQETNADVDIDTLRKPWSEPLKKGKRSLRRIKIIGVTQNPLKKN